MTSTLRPTSAARVALAAERRGFATAEVRAAAGSTATAADIALELLLATTSVRVCLEVDPGRWQPWDLARWISTADHLSGGRSAVRFADAAKAQVTVAAVRAIWSTGLCAAPLQDPDEGIFMDSGLETTEEPAAPHRLGPHLVPDADGEVAEVRLTRVSRLLAATA